MRTLFRRRSALDLGPVSKAISYVLLVAWAFVVLFPLYWLAITSLKQPIDVDSGPVYLPGVDFKPTLDAWKYILVDLQSDTVRPYVNTVVVGLSSALIALILGSSAAYALVRFRYSPRVGVIGLFVGCILFTIVALALGAAVPLAVVSAAAVFLILYQTVGRRFKRVLGILADLPTDAAAGCGRDPDLRALPTRRPARHAAGPDHHVRGDEPADRGLADA